MNTIQQAARRAEAAQSNQQALLIRIHEEELELAGYLQAESDCLHRLDADRKRCLECGCLVNVELEFIRHESKQEIRKAA